MMKLFVSSDDLPSALALLKHFCEIDENDYDSIWSFLQNIWPKLKTDSCSMLLDWIYHFDKKDSGLQVQIYFFKELIHGNFKDKWCNEMLEESAR